mgnify:CR=1 FL=1
MSKRLPDLVKSAFQKAKSTNDLTYYPTQVVDISVSSLPFQLRFSPSLASKPKGPPKSATTKPFDPFAYSPLPKLFIADLSPTHYLVLNKFAITEEHFILATKEFKPQTHVLERADLEGALECVKAFKDDGGLFVFFNGGEHSGASQPHRHLQLLPVQRMKDGLREDSPWEVLTSKLDEAPFQTFAEKISLKVSGEELYAAYLRLHHKACEAAGVQGDVAAGGEAKISYNLAMTEDVLVVCPRVAEGGVIADSNGQEVGKLSLNGTMLAGTALVKSEAEWDALNQNPQTVTNILKGVGLPKL